jgi:hypothetical protein
VTNSGPWVLLGRDFYESTLVEKKQGNYHVHVVPKDSREEAALKALDNRPHWQRSESLAFAHGDDAAQCQLGEISARSEDGRRVYALTLRPESQNSSWGGLETMLYQGLSAEEMVRKRAELILLGETTSMGDNSRDQHIRMSYGGRGDEGKIKPGVIVGTLHSLGGTASMHNLQKARLAAIYELTAARILEHVLELTLGPASRNGIPVHMEGRRHKSYDNQPAPVLSVEGRITLSQK